MKNVIFVHGISGLHTEKFLSSLEQKCKELGLAFYAPSLGSYKDEITYNGWKKYFDENILSHINSETIFISHSLGTQFAVKYFVERDLHVGLYISLAGCKDVFKIKQSSPSGFFKLAPISRQFKPTEEEFNKFKKINFEKIAMYSDDDPIFEQWNLEGYALSTGASSVKVHGKGHFSVEKIDELEELIKGLFQKNRGL